MNVVLTARVSSEEQAKGESASIDQQIADMRAFCQRMGWDILETFVDCENYRATLPPNKGKIVNPSGERADRPGLLALFEKLKTGQVDAAVCWRDDRLVRHPRVAVALEDALDLGDSRRNGRPKIQLFDATGAQIDRFTLSIKATIWREENKRRTERVTMGKIATLKQGRWPGLYDRLGYVTVKEPGKRGRAIELADPDEVEIVKNIFEWCDEGWKIRDIRRRLIADECPTKRNQKHQKRDWSPATLSRILRAEDYTGRTVWEFADGTEYEIEIPQIIEPELFERVQRRIERNKSLSTRNSKGVYLLQGLAQCGECDGGISIKVRYSRTWILADGTRRVSPLDQPEHLYRCHTADQYPDEPHPRPFYWSGEPLDWHVWRYLVDNGIRQPEALRMQVLARRQELQQQGESMDSEIGHARIRLSEVAQERAFFQRQAARGKISEAEFDTRMAETEEAKRYWELSLRRLIELRDDAIKVQRGLDYATGLLTSIQTQLFQIDQTPDELRSLPRERRDDILRQRRKILRALVQKVIIWSDGSVKLFGCLSGNEAAQIELPGSWGRS